MTTARSITQKKVTFAATTTRTLGKPLVLLKRAVKGIHVHIWSKHAWKYVCEFSYRRNMRHSHWSMFNLLVDAFALPRLQQP